MDPSMNHDPAIEQMFLGLGLTDWQYEPEFAIGKINKTDSMDNKSRLVETLNEEAVEQYAEDMLRGDMFPPLIIRKIGETELTPGRYVILSGRHRYLAYLRVDAKKVPAYIVECTPDVAAFIKYDDNRRHGWGTSQKERVAQAIELMDGHGYSLQRACEVVGTTDNRVQRGRAIIAGSQRAKRLDIEGFDELGETIKSKLQSIAADPIFEGAVMLAIDCKFQNPHVDRMMAEIKEAKSERDALMIIGDLSEQYADRATSAAAGGNYRATSLGSLRGALTKLLAVTPADVLKGLDTEDQLAVTAGRIDDGVKKLVETRRLIELRRTAMRSAARKSK